MDWIPAAIIIVVSLSAAHCTPVGETWYWVYDVVDGALLLTVGYDSYPDNLNSGDRRFPAMSRVE